MPALPWGGGMELTSLDFEKTNCINNNTDMVDDFIRRWRKDAEKSDLYDVLVYVYNASQPITREQRVDERKNQMLSPYDDKQQVFLEFVLAQYIKEGVYELDQEKLPTLLKLKYNAIPDAIEQLGSIENITSVFVGFQKYLYEPQTT